MRVLLDECLPRKLRRELPGHDVRTVPEAGWAGKKNGELLELASRRFDVFVTADRGLVHQQDLRGSRLAVVTLVTRSTRIESLRLLMPEVRELLESLLPGQVVRVEG